VKDQPQSGIIAAAAGGPLGCFVYVVAMGLTIAWAPRRAENIRSVVDLPWPVFAILPTAISFAVLLASWSVMRSQRLRLCLLATFGLAIAVCSYFGLDLLRRDYIGKF
jgi:hypothetical protein